MRTASTLGPCGYVDVLSVKRKRTPSQKKAMGLGESFHAAAAAYIQGTDFQIDDLEVIEWFRKFVGGWAPPQGCAAEVAMGLSPEGRYVEVTEPEPHRYVAVDSTAKLVTAGRADVTWPEGSLIYVGDFKSGKTHLGRPEELPQLQSLGLMAADKHGADAMVLGIYYARDGVWDWSQPIALDSAKAAEMWDRVSLYASLGPEPRPGDWCANCWEKKACSSAQH